MKLALATILVMLLNPAIGFAAPDKLEVIFLSPNRSASILPFLNKKTKGIYLSRLIAQNDTVGYEEEYVIDFSDPEGFEDAPPMRNFECVSMGDGCFNPQEGYLEEIPGAIKASKGTNKKSKQKKQKENPFELSTFNSDDIALVECQEGRYFDIFCGKESNRKVKKANLEVWIDTSASMKNVDYSSEDSYCERRFFASKMKKDCRDGIAFSVFDTARSSLGSYDNLCDYVGSNDGKRIVSWIEANSADHLVLITDVDEYHGAFREYLERTNATVRGIGTKPITAKDLIGYTSKLAKSCN